MNSSPRPFQHCLVGANPIVWSNDDFEDLAGDVPLDTILCEMRAAGFAGSELGHAYPREPGPLADALGRNGLRLVSGWHSTFLAERSYDDERARFDTHLGLLRTLGARVIIVAECTRCVHGDRRAPLDLSENPSPRLDPGEWRRLVDGLKRLCARAATEGMTVAYHHHMGTVIQGGGDLERLLGEVPALGLLLDAGHLSFAGLDPVAVARRHAARIVHVHLKSTRAEIVARVRKEAWSFYRAVAEGVFTVAGEGAVDYPAIFAILAGAGYRGWLVVEAEENPFKVPALPKAIAARDYVRQQTGV